MYRLKTLPTKIRDDIIELRKTNDNDVPYRKKVAKSVLRLYGVLKKVYTKFYDKPLTDSHPEDLKNCITRLKQWLNALTAKSANDHRRLLYRDSDSLSDDSTTYLDEELDKAAKTETKLREHIDKGSFQNFSAGGKHNSKRMKSDGRFGETFQLFTRLCAQLLSRLLGNRLARPQRICEDSSQIERLIETLRENKPLFEQFFSSQNDILPTVANEEQENSAATAVACSSAAVASVDAVSDTAFIERLIDAQRALDGIESPGLIDLMEFMRSSMSSMMKNKAQLEHLEESPDSEAVLALIDVTIVSSLMIFQLIVINFFDLNKPPKTTPESEKPPQSTETEKQTVETQIESENSSQNNEETNSESYITAPTSTSTDSLATVIVNEHQQQCCFEIVEEPPTSHMYVQESFDNNLASAKFLKSVRHEYKLLQNSLTADIFVKTYERYVRSLIFLFFPVFFLR